MTARSLNPNTPGHNKRLYAVAKTIQKAEKAGKKPHVDFTKLWPDLIANAIDVKIWEDKDSNTLSTVETMMNDNTIMTDPALSQEDNETLKSRIAEKDREIAAKDEELAYKEAEIANKNRALQAAATVNTSHLQIIIDNQAQKIQALQNNLTTKTQQLAEKVKKQPVSKNIIALTQHEAVIGLLEQEKKDLQEKLNAVSAEVKITNGLCTDKDKRIHQLQNQAQGKGQAHQRAQRGRPEAGADIR